MTVVDRVDAMHEMVTNEKAISSDKVRGMLGLSLHGWENIMLWSLALAALFAAAVGISTYCVVQLQRHELDASKKEFDQYKLAAAGEVARANESAAKANERAGELAIALKQRENRKIASEQRTAIVDRLKPLPDKGKVFVNALFGDAEAFQFSDQILSVLKEAGYAAEEVPQSARLISLNRTGLFLWMKDVQNPPERAKNIATAFRLVGIEMLGDANADMSDSDAVVLVVSSHP